MIKLYLSPSNQSANRYCVGNTTEKAQMEALAKRLKALLEVDYDCHVCMATLALGIGQTGRPREARELGCDVYLALHSNAGSPTASGAVAFYHPDSKTGKALAMYIVKELDAACPIPSNRSQSVLSGMAAYNGAGYGEIRTPTQYGMVAVLAEINFHDNPITAQWLLEHQQDAAGALARALAKVLHIPQKVTDAQALYKVQVGAFASKANAEQLLAKLKSAGFQGYIKSEKQET